MLMLRLRGPCWGNQSLDGDDVLWLLGRFVQTEFMTWHLLLLLLLTYITCGTSKLAGTIS